MASSGSNPSARRKVQWTRALVGLLLVQPAAGLAAELGTELAVLQSVQQAAATTAPTVPEVAAAQRPVLHGFMTRSSVSLRSSRACSR